MRLTHIHGAHEALPYSAINGMLAGAARRWGPLCAGF